MPGVEREFGAFGHVGEEDVAHPSIEFRIVYNQAAFEVVFETAVVEVGRACDHDIVVDDHGFGM